MTGNVHSIQTLGGTDGPGVRMVIFLQGCRLRCAWCHNPDTWNMEGGCETEVEELVRKARRYRSYYGQNGGVTLSGGEPLLQAGFAAELLKQLKAQGISTAIDTAGVIVTQEVEQVLVNTDVVLLDIKLTEETSYKKHTGGSLSIAMDFLNKAVRTGCRIWIRHVVIPGINDTEEDIDKLYGLLERYKEAIERVELLPYHRLGMNKYEKLGMSYKLDQVPNMEATRLKALSDRLEWNLARNKHTRD